MDNLDRLSDDELRRRLLQYGFPNYPVTSTSRKILIKKLRNYIDGQKTKLRRETSYATRYSSDEETTDKDLKNRRGRSTITTTSPKNVQHKMLPPQTTSRATVPSISPKISSSTLPKRSTITYSLPSTHQQIPMQTNNLVHISPPIVSTNDSDDDSDYYAPINEKRNSPSSTPPKSVTLMSRLTANPNNRYEYSPTPPTTSRNSYSFNHSNDENDYLHTNNNYSSSSKFQSPASATVSGLHKRETIATNGHKAKATPYMSEFTKRLLSFRGTTTESPLKRQSDGMQYSSTSTLPYNNIVYHSDALFKNDENKHLNIGQAFKNFFNKLDEHYSVKQTLVPCILLSGLIIFFVSVAFMYLTITPNLASTLNPKETIYTICHHVSRGSEILDKTGNNYNNNVDNSNIIMTTAASSFTCIEQNELNDALNLLKLIAPELQKRIEHYKCKDSSKIGYYTMSARDIVKNIIDKNPNLRVTVAIKTLHNMEYLIEQNPQWLINHCDANGNLLTFDEVTNLRNTQGNYFAILNPRLPFTCFVYNKLQTFFLIVGGIGLIVLSFYSIIILYRFIKRMQLERKEKIDNLIFEIINYLMEQSTINGQANNQSTLVVVNHLRDKLITPSQRNEMEWAWQKAIKYLENNDSRIQFEIGNRNGEDCRMIRWIDTATISSPNQSLSSNVSGGVVGGIGTSAGAANTTLINHSTKPYLQQDSPIKKWQSRAFDKSNKIREPPTTCLKIRQMFDKFEANNTNLKSIIQNAILEKVGTDCKIYDIQLDVNSCCVYVHCATIKDAGRLHDEINGWWFDNRLLSIKFLRVNRYMERFPNSSVGPQYLRPTNTKNASMTNCLSNNNNNDNNNNKSGYNYDNDVDEYDEDYDEDDDDSGGGGGGHIGGRERMNY